jgi:hypothetical protein
MSPSAKQVLHAIAWPPARMTHPSFYGILLVLNLLHVALGLVSIFATHNTPLWFYFGGDRGLDALGIIHVIIATVMFAGMYLGHYALVRAAMLCSITCYLLKFCLFTAAVIRSRLLPGVIDLSWETPIFTAGLALLSLAVYWQPTPSSREYQVLH